MGQLNPKNTVDDLDKIIYRWNLNNPIDRWWRDKYKISFNSTSHRVVCVFDQVFEYREDLIFSKIQKEFENKDSQEYTPGLDIFKPITEEERRVLLEKIDTESFLDAIESGS